MAGRGKVAKSSADLRFRHSCMTMITASSLDGSSTAAGFFALFRGVFCCSMPLELWLPQTCCLQMATTNLYPIEGEEWHECPLRGYRDAVDYDTMNT